MKLLGHALAPRLVFGIHLMAEGRRFHIKRNSNPVGLVLIFEIQQNIHKTLDGVRESAVLGGENFYSVKRAVDNAVAVNNKKSHKKLPSAPQAKMRLFSLLYHIFEYFSNKKGRSLFL